MKVTGAQIRAARAFLKWTIADLAEKADVGISTIQAVEKYDGIPAIKGGGVMPTLEHRESSRIQALDKITAALTDAGITFLPDAPSGIGLRGRLKR